MSTKYSTILPEPENKYRVFSRKWAITRKQNIIISCAKNAPSFKRSVKDCIYDDLLTSGGTNVVKLIKREIDEESNRCILELKRRVKSLEEKVAAYEHQQGVDSKLILMSSKVLKLFFVFTTKTKKKKLKNKHYYHQS